MEVRAGWSSKMGVQVECDRGQNGSSSGVASGGAVEWLVEVHVEVRVGCESGVRGVQGESWVRSICAR